MPLSSDLVHGLQLAREHVLRAVPDVWPELAEVLRVALDDPLPEVIGLPLAACLCSGGAIERATAGAAAWAALNLSLRVLDDLVDRDRPDAWWAHVGPGRAYHLAAGLRELATHILVESLPDAPATRLVLQDLSRTMMRVGSGQDRDITCSTLDIESYFRTIADKSGALFAAICRLGVRLGGADHDLALQALSQFGYHLGIALQLLDDWQSTLIEEGARDLQRGKLSFPLQIAPLLSSDVQLSTLRELVSAGPPWQVAQLASLLVETGAQQYTLWMAHKERDRALKCLAAPSLSNTSALERLCSIPFPLLPQ